MTESSRIERAREFVRKFNNDEFDYIENANEEQLNSLDWLADAKEKFEKADEEKTSWKEPPAGLIDPQVVNLDRRTINYNFENALKQLLFWMGQTKVGNLYVDSKIKKEIEEFKKNKAKIEQERDNYRMLNEKLVPENVRFRDKLGKIFDEFPEVQSKYGWLIEDPRKEESEID